MDGTWEARIGEDLLAWYMYARRDLPWRRTRDPYAIWVSEVMLQQTRVETVLRYYPAFLSAFPTVRALAGADPDQVLKHWEGLGYYRRARMMHRGAMEIMEQYGGQMPDTCEALRRIHGIGEYTAGAVASIAYGEQVPAMDGNAFRVYARLTDEEGEIDRATTRRRLTETAMQCIPQGRAGEMNQAVMDLGSMICRPGVPDCRHCPLQVHCRARAAGRQSDLPRKTPPRQKQHFLYGMILMVNDRGEVCMLKRTESLLEGLWIFPICMDAVTVERMQGVLEAHGIRCSGKVRLLGEYQHVFTHQVWDITVFGARWEQGPLPEGWVWRSMTQLQESTVPSAMRGGRNMLAEAFRADTEA